MATSKLSKEFIVKSYSKNDSPSISAYNSAGVSLNIETISGYKVVAATPFFASGQGFARFANAIGTESPSWDIYLSNPTSSTISANRAYGVTVVYQKI